MVQSAMAEGGEGIAEKTLSRKGEAQVHFDQSILLRLKKNICRDKYYLILVSPVVIYYIVFHYLPMYGAIIAFKDFSISKGIWGSHWVGFRWFNEFFRSIYFSRLIKNTVLLSVNSILWGFPVPILFALMLNELKDGIGKRFIQTVSYLPHFISVVVVVGMMVNFLSPIDGIVNMAIKLFGNQPVGFINDPSWFRTLYVGSEVWQTFGWNSIIYLAALSSINPEYYEAAKIDGASRWKQLIHVTIPQIMPTIVILFILRVGQIMNIGFEKIILMYNPSTYTVADVISTYVYRRGILNSEFSFATAVGLFNSAINFVMVVAVNFLAKRKSEVGLW